MEPWSIYLEPQGTAECTLGIANLQHLWVGWWQWTVVMQIYFLLVILTWFTLSSRWNALIWVLWVNWPFVGSKYFHKVSYLWKRFYCYYILYFRLKTIILMSDFYVQPLRHQAYISLMDMISPIPCKGCIQSPLIFTR